MSANSAGSHRPYSRPWVGEAGATRRTPIDDTPTAEAAIEAADQAFAQFFLHDERKIAALIDAAAIRPGDRVLELGGGLGTISRAVPGAAALTVVELDERLVPLLAREVPRAGIVRGDGMELVRSHRFDVLISSLPIGLGEVLIREVLPALSWRVAVVAIEPRSPLDDLTDRYRSVAVLTTASGDDYRPRQPAVSRFVRLLPATTGPERGRCASPI